MGLQGAVLLSGQDFSALLSQCFTQPMGASFKSRNKPQVQEAGLKVIRVRNQRLHCLA